MVRPTLLLLQDPRLEAIDQLYRTGFERFLSGDPAGAVTSATSAVEEMLRAVTGVRGSTLGPLAKKARNDGVIDTTVFKMVEALAPFRQVSDAHTAGTDDPEMARLVLNLVGSILLYLGGRLPA